jgi:dUTP pyrophosphatase
VKFVKLSKTAKIPTRKTKFSAGYDFYADETITIPPLGVVVVPTNIGIEDMKTNQYLQVSLRSSSSIEIPVVMANGVGIIDADYPSDQSIGCILFNRMPNMRVTIDKGMRIMQGVLLNYHTIDDEIPPTKERVAGYGSTNN